MARLDNIFHLFHRSKTNIVQSFDEILSLKGVVSFCALTTVKCLIYSEPNKMEAFITSHNIPIFFAILPLSNPMSPVIFHMKVLEVSGSSSIFNKDDSLESK